VTKHEKPTVFLLAGNNFLINNVIVESIIKLQALTHLPQRRVYMNGVAGC
jgi:chemotaxis signal transduction protein